MDEPRLAGNQHPTIQSIWFCASNHDYHRGTDDLCAIKVMAPPPTNPGDQAAQMSKTMNLTMPLLMGFIAYSLSSGLALYFIVSNLLGIAQYGIMGKANWSSLFRAKNQPSLRNRYTSVITQRIAYDLTTCNA